MPLSTKIFTLIIPDPQYVLPFAPPRPSTPHRGVSNYASDVDRSQNGG